MTVTLRVFLFDAAPDPHRKRREKRRRNATLARRQLECALSRWFTDPRNVKQYSRRMESCGYMQIGNEDAKDGYWKVGGKRMAVYAKKDMSLREQLQAVTALCSKPEGGEGS
jgi:hypothetical protein